MKIVIVSYKRAENVTTAKLFKPGDLVIACPESQAEEYKKHNEGFELFLVPDNVEGNIGRKRNYILDKIDDDILMLDDDIDHFGYHEYSTDKLYTKMTREEVLAMIEQGFRMAHEAGVVLWGISMQSDPRFFKEYTPFNMLSPVLGPFRGIIKNPIRNDESLNSKDDYDYFLQVIHKYHKVLRFNKYYYKCGHLTNKGGIATFRSMDKEMEWNKMLVKKWGSNVVDIDRRTQHGNKTVNPKIHVPINGV